MSAKDKIFKTLDFLTMRKQVFTTDNISTVGLVLLFMAVFMIFGGKISPPPKIQKGTGFGSISLEQVESKDVDKQSSTLEESKNRLADTPQNKPKVELEESQDSLKTKNTNYHSRDIGKVNAQDNLEDTGIKSEKLEPVVEEDDPWDNLLERMNKSNTR